MGTLVLSFGYDLCEYWQLAVGPGVGWGQLGGAGGQVHGGQVYAAVDFVGLWGCVGLG